jgi:hypothetical protein
MYVVQRIANIFIWICRKEIVFESVEWSAEFKAEIDGTNPLYTFF